MKIDRNSPEYKFGYLAGYRDGYKDGIWVTKKGLKELIKGLDDSVEDTKKNYDKLCEAYFEEEENKSPCVKCSIETKQSCCGCPEYSEWKKKQEENK